MKRKNDQIISFRVDADTCAWLDEVADLTDWTVSHLVRVIVQGFLSSFEMIESECDL